ncbi:MAG: heme-binding domain-containing protein [Thermoanaerobaculia bacterium]|nr:heme-binding domain-containing protein [Thermoanaerobaculia bacterium]
MKKYLKPALYALLAIFLLAQFIRPAKNLSNDQSRHLSTKYPIPAEVESVLKVACYDCHSNYTIYPWYAWVQPVAAWLANHVNEGKRELNFSELATRRIAVQNKKMEEVIELVREGEMPLASYTWVHRDAMLSQEQKDLLINWAQSVMDTLSARYPADSLVLRRNR